MLERMRWDLSNKSGFTLVELMVTCAIAAIVMLSIATLSNIPVLGSRSDYSSATFDSRVSEIAALLLYATQDPNNDICTETLLNQTFDPTATGGSSIVIIPQSTPSSTPIAQEGYTLPDQSIQFTKVRLMPISNLGSIPVSYTGTQYNLPIYMVQLQLQAQKKGKFLGSSLRDSNVIYLSIVTSQNFSPPWPAQNQILMCWGQAAALEQSTCAAQGKVMTYAQSGSPPSNISLGCQ
jgi:prepilin-type N-terminal cleavage/methylation domain-containing protein